VTGGRQYATKYEALSKRLARFLMDADTTGDGIPNRGTANTIDDASPAVQYAKKSTYLGVKTLCALKSVERMAELYWNDMSFARVCRRARRPDRRDHRGRSLARAITTRSASTEPTSFITLMFGRETNSSSSAAVCPDGTLTRSTSPVGLLYWMLSGESVSELGLDARRVLTDLRNSLRVVSDGIWLQSFLV